jgi:hypothetical protein
MSYEVKGGFIHDELANRLVVLANILFPDWHIMLMDNFGWVRAYGSAGLVITESGSTNGDFERWVISAQSVQVAQIAPIGIKWESFRINRIY